MQATAWPDGKQNFMEELFEGALGCHSCHGFLYGGGVDTPRPTSYVLFVIHLSMCFIHIPGVALAPKSEFRKQMARNLTDVDDGFLLK